MRGLVFTRSGNTMAANFGGNVIGTYDLTQGALGLMKWRREMAALARTL